jgi:hypothetical protein
MIKLINILKEVTDKDFIDIILDKISSKIPLKFKEKEFLEKFSKNENTQTYFSIQNEIDKEKFEALAKKNDWVYYTGDMAYDDIIEIGEEYKLILDKDGYYIVYPILEKPYNN